MTELDNNYVSDIMPDYTQLNDCSLFYSLSVHSRLYYLFDFFYRFQSTAVVFPRINYCYGCSRWASVEQFMRVWK
jgi:hypothetical protein